MGDQKLLGKTPLRGNPSPEMTYLPTYLTDLTAGLTGTRSDYPNQAGTHPSRIDTCYADADRVPVQEATYGDLPPADTGHRSLEFHLIIPNLPPPAA